MRIPKGLLPIIAYLFYSGKLHYNRKFIGYWSGFVVD